MQKKIDEATFRKAMSTFATGVAIMTCRGEDGRAVGMTVNSFTSVSLEPPLVLWCINQSIAPTAAFDAASHFAVHVLHRGQETLSNHFAVDTEDKFDGIEHSNGVAELPILTDFLSAFQCKIRNRVTAGDHTIVIGELVDYEIRDREPLIFYGSNYRSLG